MNQTTPRTGVAREASDERDYCGLEGAGVETSSLVSGVGSYRAGSGGLDHTMGRQGA